MGDCESIRFWCGLSGKASLEMNESPREGRSSEVTYDVVVIGAGQAGLAMGYFLEQQVEAS